MRTKDENKLMAIFDATVSLTAKVGIAGLKMSLIAKEAEIAAGTIYLYYKNKKDLLNAVYTNLKSEGIFSVIGKIEHLPIQVQLFRLWEVAFEYHVANINKSVFIEQFELSPMISSENKVMEEDSMSYLHKTLEEAKKRGIVKPIDNHIIMSLILGFMKHLAAQATKDSLDTSEDVKHLCYSMCWNAIRENNNE
ncbi:TetR/AcrR family transcriptional regulator [Winogradskyella sp.]|uniref:TetR/AcrR family transcriptional regulator n=1 Tax=Winogradskyella sp. TaxID=1883156 RepID=UPI00260F1279|nr:TetR/AcrR family transcriptional regulator [Winogradskyella sp.]